MANPIGYPAGQKNRKWSANDLADIRHEAEVAHYCSDAIGAGFGVTGSRIRQLCRKHGIRLIRAAQFTNDVLERAHEMRLERVRVDDIADKLGVDRYQLPVRLCYWRAARGLSPRARA